MRTGCCSNFQKIHDLGIFDDFGNGPSNTFKRHNLKERQKRINRFILHSPHPYALPHPSETFHLRHPGVAFNKKPSNNNNLTSISDPLTNTVQVPCISQNQPPALPKFHFLNPANDWVSQMSFEPTLSSRSIPVTVSPTLNRRTSF